jgi:hypothetical protein
MYESKAEKEAKRWISESQAIEHICQAEGCDEAEARRQLNNAIEDMPVMVYRKPPHRNIGMATAPLWGDPPKPIRLLRHLVETTWPRRRKPGSAGGSRPSESQVREFVANEQAAGRPLSEKHLMAAAEKARLHASRDQLRAARKKIAPATRGRPKKSRP